MMKYNGGTRKSSSTRIGNKSGLAPGTPVFVGERKRDRVRIDIMDFAGDRLDEKRGASIEECQRLKDAAGVTWININGIHDTALVAALAERFGFHPLTLEDIVNTAHRPKTEEFDAYIFVVLKMMSYNDATGDVAIEHVSLIFGDGYVLSFLEDEGDVFDAVRERIRSAKGRIRKLKADYLAYALMDAVVDNYFVALERIGERIETLDDEIVAGPRPQHMHAIHRLKRSILALRRSVWGR